MVGKPVFNIFEIVYRHIIARNVKLELRQSVTAETNGIFAVPFLSENNPEQGRQKRNFYHCYPIESV